MEVSIRELKARLSEYLRRVRRGEELRVTHRGRVIARLIQPEENGSHTPSADEVVRRLRAMPGILPGKGGKPVGGANPIRIGPGERTLADIVLENRD